MYHDFIAKLQEEINKGLPGWDAQKKLAPPNRPKEQFIAATENTPRESGVLVWLYPKGNTIYTRLILRVEGRVHSGQVAFPGGKKEETDKSFWNTALREAQEEVGLPTEQIKLVGALTPLYIPPSNFWVNPFIGTSDTYMPATINKTEVQACFDVDIIQLLQPKTKTEGPITLSSGEQRITPFYTLEGHTVWGATAMILSELEELIRRTGFTSF